MERCASLVIISTTKVRYATYGDEGGHDQDLEREVVHALHEQRVQGLEYLFGLAVVPEGQFPLLHAGGLNALLDVRPQVLKDLIFPSQFLQIVEFLGEVALLHVVDHLAQLVRAYWETPIRRHLRPHDVRRQASRRLRNHRLHHVQIRFISQWLQTKRPR